MNALPRHALLWAVLLLITATPFAAFGLTPAELDRLERALEAFAHEPDIYAVQHRVLVHRDLHDGRPQRWSRRARLANLLPQVQGQTNWLDQRDRQDQFRENINADDFGIYERNNAQHLWRDNLRFRSIYSLRLSFDLSQLVYSNAEMGIQREVRSRWQQRDQLVELATELYFERRSLQVEAHLFGEGDLADAIRRRMAIDALTARLDALTGGWFRRQLQEANR